MVTLIRTLKRINKSTPARAPPIQSQSRPNESSTTNNIITAQTPQHVTAAAGYGYDHHDAQLKRTANSAIDVIKLNEKGKTRAPSNTSNNSPPPPQKASSIAIADTDSIVRSAAANYSKERSNQILPDRKRKSSSEKNEEPAPKKVARKRKKCRSEGCSNYAVQAGVCFGVGQGKVKRCNSEQLAYVLHTYYIPLPSM